MPPVEPRTIEVPDISVASRHRRNRIKKRNKLARAQLLLASSELDAAAIAELADLERCRVAAARSASAARTAELALADHVRNRAGCPVFAAPHQASVDAADVSDLARRALRESRDQYSLERQVVARLEAGPSRPRQRRPSPPAVLASISPFPSPVLDLPACDPAAAPEPRSDLDNRLELEVVELRRVVASLEAEREEKRLRLHLLESSARPAPRAEELLADRVLPGGLTVAQALAEKDARIEQLRFALADRSGRRLDDRLGRAAAFVHDPENLFASLPSAGPAAGRVSPRSRGPSPRPAGRSPPPSPPPAGRPAPLFSWGLGLARGVSSHDQRARLARSASADIAPLAGALASSPPA